jgi:pyruvate kinase
MLLPLDGYNEDDLIVLVAGNVPGVEGSTNFILVHRMGEVDH